MPEPASLRRTRALARDEHRLRVALAAHEDRRFDLDTAETLRERTEDLIETVAAIAADDDFWSRLEHAAARPLTAEQVGRLAELDETTLAVLLEVSGYRTPPPPPVGTLVDDTLADLAAALSEPPPHVARPDPAAGVAAARGSLITFVLRVRRQVTELEPTPLSPGVARASARRVGRAARWLLPKVAAASAGAAVEAVAPGTGVGLVVGKALHKVAEDGMELAATLAAARIPDGAQPAADPPPLAPVDPVRTHAAALLDHLDGLRRAAERRGPYSGVEGDELGLARRAGRHLRRLEDVLGDAGALDHDTREALDLIAGTLTSYRDAGAVGADPQRLDVAGHVAGELARRAGPASI